MSSPPSSSYSSSFTLPFHPTPHQRDPSAAPRPMPTTLAPLLNMLPAENPSYPTVTPQTTHALCSKSAAEQQKHEPRTLQGDNEWRAASGDMPASHTIGHTIGQTTTGRQPARQTGLCEPDERKRRDDVGWVDWVGW